MAVASYAAAKSVASKKTAKAFASAPGSCRSKRLSDLEEKARSSPVGNINRHLAELNQPNREPLTSLTSLLPVAATTSAAQPPSAAAADLSGPVDPNALNTAAPPVQVSGNQAPSAAAPPVKGAGSEAPTDAAAAAPPVEGATRDAALGDAMETDDEESSPTGRHRASPPNKSSQPRPVRPLRAQP